MMPEKPLATPKATLTNFIDSHSGLISLYADDIGAVKVSWTGWIAMAMMKTAKASQQSVIEQQMRQPTLLKISALMHEQSHLGHNGPLLLPTFALFL